MGNKNKNKNPLRPYPLHKYDFYVFSVPINTWMQTKIPVLNIFSLFYISVGHECNTTLSANGLEVGGAW